MDEITSGVRRATPADTEALTRIAFAAKRHWGYPERWMERWREGLTIKPEFVRENEVYSAVVEGEIVGFYALVEGGAVLEHLWVSPEWMGRGVGRVLFEHTVERAGALGAAVLEIESDPNAEGFYCRMGAWRMGENFYEMDGLVRTLPVLSVSLSQ